MAIERPRIQYLESIRGLAALMVVLFHFAYAFWPFMVDLQSPTWEGQPHFLKLLASSPLTFAISGQFAVTIFFVLSGFVLSYSYFQGRRIESVQSAAIRRYFRLALPVLLSVLASFVLCKHRMYHNLQAARIYPSAWLATWYDFKPHLGGTEPNSALWQGLFGVFFRTENSYNHVLWTMAVELPGSFLIFAFLALFGTTRHRWLIYLAIGALLWMQALVYQLDFLAGAALCDAYARLELRRQPPFELGWFALPIILLACWLGRLQALPPGADQSQMARWQATPSLGALLVVGVPLFSNWSRRALDWLPLVILGRLSFGLYLAHVLVVCSLGSAIYVQLRTVEEWSHNSAACVAAGASLIGSLVGGAVFFLIGDLPSIALGRWVASLLLPKRLDRPTPAAPMAATL